MPSGLTDEAMPKAFQQGSHVTSVVLLTKITYHQFAGSITLQAQLVMVTMSTRWMTRIVCLVLNTYTSNKRTNHKVHDWGETTFLHEVPLVVLGPRLVVWANGEWVLSGGFDQSSNNRHA